MRGALLVRVVRHVGRSRVVPLGRLGTGGLAAASGVVHRLVRVRLAIDVERPAEIVEPLRREFVESAGERRGKPTGPQQDHVVQCERDQEFAVALAQQFAGAGITQHLQGGQRVAGQTAFARQQLKRLAALRVAQHDEPPAAGQRRVERDRFVVAELDQPRRLQLVVAERVAQRRYGGRRLAPTLEHIRVHVQETKRFRRRWPTLLQEAAKDL